VTRGLTAVDGNVRRRNSKERNQIFGSNMAASISNYKLATKKKYGAIQPDGTVPEIQLQKLTAQTHYF